MGSLNKNSVCFQCVGALCGPVLKLTSFPLSLMLSFRLTFPGTCHTSASAGSPSLTSCTCASAGTAAPDGVKNVSK